MLSLIRAEKIFGKTLKFNVYATPQLRTNMDLTRVYDVFGGNKSVWNA